MDRSSTICLIFLPLPLSRISLSDRQNTGISGGDGLSREGDNRSERPARSSVGVGIDCMTDAEDASVADDEDDHSKKLKLLHESLLAKREPSLLPLYPPGDAFLVCNSSHNRDGGGVSSSGSSILKSATGLNDVGDHSGVDGGEIVSSNGRVCDGSSGLGSPSKAPSSTLSVAAGRRAHEGEGQESPSEEGLRVVRVSQLHFLRMNLSPSMVADHTITSYQGILARLKQRLRSAPLPR